MAFGFQVIQRGVYTLLGISVIIMEHNQCLVLNELDVIKDVAVYLVVTMVTVYE